MNTLDQKVGEYKQYINNHQANVWKAWIENLSSFIVYFNIDNTISLNKAIIEHDASKHSKEEFEPYRKQFFPVNDKEKEGNKESFDMAWEHHYKNNPHHWNYWVDEETNIPKEMDDENIVHMLCDWMGMGMQFNNTAAEYYEKNKDKINLAPNTRIKVESYLAKM